MRKTYTWEGYRKHLEGMLNKGFVDAYYEELFSEEKWSTYVCRYRHLVMPVMKAIAPDIDHKAMWEKTKDIFS